MKQSLIFGVLAVVPALCAAQSDLFHAVDRNGDRSISSEEWYGQRLAPVPFTVVDLNGDGRISESEFREWGSARGGVGVVGITPADRFRVIDKNRDNVISSGEWKDGAHSLTPFASADANKDGKISQREFITWDRQRGGPVAATPGSPIGTVAPAMSERLRSLDRGVAGPSGPTGVPGPSGVQPTTPPTPSSLTPSPPSPVTSTPGTTQAPGISSPSLGTATGNTTR